VAFRQKLQQLNDPETIISELLALKER
jgi:hypothetical protein